MAAVVPIFLKRQAVFSLIVGAVSTILFFILQRGSFTPAFPFLFVFFNAIAFLTYYFLYKSIRNRFIKFLNSYLIATILKLFIYVTVMIFYIMNHKEDAIPFAISFFLLYLLYNIFEVIALLDLSKRFNIR